MQEHQSRFKAYLLPSAQVKTEAPVLRLFLEEILTSSASAAEKALLFVLVYLEQRRPGAWAMKSGRAANENGFDLKNLSPRFDFLCLHEARTAADLTVSLRLRQLPEAVFTTLCRWHRGDWRINACDQVISSREMLRLQARGERVATLHWKAALNGELVDGRRDALEFLLHDLVHAELFFLSPQAHQSQRDFFTALLKLVEDGTFEESLRVDERFARDFDYLISDMNADPHHLAQVLRASCLKHELFRENEGKRLSAAGQKALRARLQDFQRRGGFQISLLGD